MTGRTISFGIVFLIPVFLARSLTQSQFGVYKQIFLVFNTLFPMLQMGMVASLYYFMPKGGDSRGSYVMQGFLTIISAGLLFALVMNLTGKPILSTFNLLELEPFILPLSGYMFLMLAAAPLEALLIIEQKVKAASVIIILTDSLRAMTIILPVVLAHDLLLMMYLLLISSGVRAALMLGYMYRSSYLSLKNVHSGNYHSQLKFAVPFAMAVAVSILSLEIHQYIVAYTFDPVIFAIYAVGCFQLPLLSIFYESTSTVLMTRITELQKDGLVEELVELWKYFQVKLALLFIPVFIFLFTTAEEVITVIFTANYSASVKIFYIMVFNVPLNMFLTHTILRSFGESKYILMANLANFAMTVGLIFIFIRYLGISGVALGTITGLTATKCIELFKIKKLCSLSMRTIIPWKDLGKILAIAASCAVVTKIVKDYSGLQALPSLILSAVVFFTMYLAIVIRTSLVSSDEKNYIWGYVKKAALMSRQT